MGLIPGVQLDRYELLAPVAEGGMGQVWLARLLGKRGFEKLVAIKVSKLTSDVHFQQMFLDEARIASAIEHVNVAQILELGEQDDVLYIVMEWVDGDSLSTLLRRLDKTKTPLPLPIALRIVSETCAGAHAAHELKDPSGNLLEVVHRDISPQNILLTRAGSVKLIDFGIAKARSRASAETTFGTIKGKMKYMAPEQARGTALDRRADVFSLGSVLYRMLAGHPPYEGANEVATLHYLLSGAPPPQLPSSVPFRVAEVVYRALAHGPAARFQTAAEMQDALGKVMVDCELLATAADVAAFVSSHLHAQQSRRAYAIEIALRAAGDRASDANVIPLSPSAFSTSRPPRESPSASSSSGTPAVQPLAASHPTASMGTGIEGPRSERLPIVRWLVSGALVLGAIGLVLIGIVTATRPPAKTAADARTTAATSSTPSVPVPTSPIDSSSAPPARTATAATGAGDAAPIASAATAGARPSTKSAPKPRAGAVMRSSKPAAAPTTRVPDFGY